MSSSSSNPTTIPPASQDPTTSPLTTLSPASQDDPAISPLTTQTLYQPAPTTSNFAVFIFLTSPIIALLPPRKLDLYTFCLGSAFVLSAGHIYSSDLPASLRLRRFINYRQKYYSSAPNNNNNNDNNNHNYLTTNSITAAAAAAQAVERLDEEGNQEDRDDEGGVKRMAKKLWMGNETPGWEGRRVAREREVLDEGRGIGYGELIGESIMDVFGGKREIEDKGKGD